MDQAAPQKPTSLIVIGILIIVLAVFSAIGAFGMVALKDDPNFASALEAAPVGIDTLIAVTAGGAVIMLIAGIGILMGANWGRWLYVIYSVAGIGFGFFTNPNLIQILPSLVIFAIFAFFLF